MSQVSIARPLRQSNFVIYSVPKTLRWRLGMINMLINKQDSENVCSSQIILKFSIKPMIERDTYKYLGIDNNITYVGPIKKQRIPKEYYHRIKKIYNLELLSFKKVIANKTAGSSTCFYYISRYSWLRYEWNRLNWQQNINATSYDLVRTFISMEIQVDSQYTKVRR